MNKDIKAIIFDLGGVCLGSPLNSIRDYELENNIPREFINVIISSWGSAGPFQKLERGEIDYNEFYSEFHRLLNLPENIQTYKKYLKLKNIDSNIDRLNTNFTINGKEMFIRMMNEASKPNYVTLNAIKKLKTHYKVIALTNSVAPWDSNQKGFEHLEKEFDKIIYSHKIGMRKPDVKIFEYTLNQINAKADECIFLDDIGKNLKPAKQLGMKTILFKSNKSEESIKELGNILNMNLTEYKPSNL